MKKLFLLVAVAAAVAAPAAAAPVTVTLQASPTTTTFGGAVTLSGQVSSGAAGQAVTVEAQDCGTSAFKKLATATTASGGTYTTSAKPTMNTTYRARLKNQTSQPVLVKVRPQLKLVRVAAGKFTAKVGAAQSFQGKYVAFQRYASATRKWVTLKKVTLTKVNQGGTTIVSYATFRVKVKARTKVRISMPLSQAGTCYAPGNSGSIRA